MVGGGGLTVISDISLVSESGNQELPLSVSHQRARLRTAVDVSALPQALTLLTRTFSPDEPFICMANMLWSLSLKGTLFFRNCCTISQYYSETFLCGTNPLSTSCQ